MSELEILIHQDQNTFKPGETLAGSIRWQLDSPPQGLTLQLFWHTSGKGSTDIHLENSLDFSSSQASGTAPFQFVLPDGPYSFSGNLISLHWVLEIVSQPGSLNHRLEFILSPSGKEIVLPKLPPSAPAVSLGTFRAR